MTYKYIFDSWSMLLNIEFKNGMYNVIVIDAGNWIPQDRTAYPVGFAWTVSRLDSRHYIPLYDPNEILKEMIK